MRFNLFGFKGELSTSGQKKKKGKTNEEDVIVGGTFRVQSEFGPSSSRFKTKSMNGAKLAENTAKNGSVKPQNWCGTPIPKQDVPPPPGGYNAEVTPKQNDVKSKQPKSNLKKVAPIPPQIEPEIEKKPQPEAIKIQTEVEPKSSTKIESKSSIKIESKSESESEDEFGAKISKPTQNHTSNQNDFKTVGNENQKKFITLDGFDNNDNESSDESEDEYGAIKSTKKTEDNTYYGTQNTSFEKVQIKQPQESPKAPKTPNTKSNFGYSDQAASIFFRSDSPEPEQRVRNFSIKKGDGDDDDNLSQTSA
nr:uncharacterized G-patch domain protein DDB_G0278987-like [Onthophagus taurus]